MPRQSKGAHLVWKNEARKADGSIRHRAQWFIHDGTKRHPTGCGKSDIGSAQIALANYIATLYKPAKLKHRDPAGVPVADAVMQYSTDKVAKFEDRATRDDTLSRLQKSSTSSGKMMIGDITGLSATTTSHPAQPFNPPAGSLKTSAPP